MPVQHLNANGQGTRELLCISSALDCIRAFWSIKGNSSQKCHEMPPHRQKQPTFEIGSFSPLQPSCCLLLSHAAADLLCFLALLCHLPAEQLL